MRPTGEASKSTDKLSEDQSASSKATNEQINRCVKNESSTQTPNLNQLKLRTKSMSDDLLDTKADTAIIDNVKTVQVDQTNSTQLNSADKECARDRNSVIRIIQNDDTTSNAKSEQNRPSNVKQKREQLIQHLRQIEQTKSKCKSMVSLSQASSDEKEFDTSSSNNFFLLKSSNNPPNNKLELNRSASRLNAARSNSKLDSSPPIDRLTGNSVVGKVASLNSLNNLHNSTSNLITGDKVNCNSTPPAHLASNQLQQTKSLPVNGKISTLTSNKSNTINSQTNMSHYSTAVSRNNSSSSSSSSTRSTNSGYLTGLSSTDNQSNESNGNKQTTAVEASRLRKKIQNKKARNSKFYVHLNDESAVDAQAPHQFSTRLLNRNRVVTNRASLNLNNNDGVDELTKKFIEKGLSGSLKMLSASNDDELSEFRGNKCEDKHDENRRSLNIEKKLSVDLISPTYV